ncbi:hypothetical protein [Streptomyces sp. NPDC045369]|uniref:hypothetical protein n=1 Tax=Streptomyces sp. NPDC045369 TaxID=3155732 RepID=UPI0033D0048B
MAGLAGQRVHLIGGDSSETVLAGHLFADPGFAVLGTEVPQAVPPWGLFQTAPESARRKALAWQRHIREVECGSPDGLVPVPRPPAGAGTVGRQRAAVGVAGEQLRHPRAHLRTDRCAVHLRDLHDTGGLRHDQTERTVNNTRDQHLGGVFK